MPRPRKPRPMKWHVFLGRRGIVVSAWLTELNIRSYDSLVEWCEASNVEPPERADVRGWFGIKKSSRKPKASKQPPRPPEKKASNKKDDEE